MVEETAVARAPMWKSFLVGLFLFSVVFGPALGMFFYFFRPISVYFDWYVGTSLVLGVAIGVGFSAVIALVFASRASR